MQLNTFFCRQGVDSNLRLGLINLAGFLLVLLFYVLLAGHGTLFIVVLAAAILASLSAKRRLQGQSSALILAPALGTMLFGVGLILDMPIVICIAALLSILALGVISMRPLPNSGRRFDAFGYSGPLVSVRQARSRVEPTLESGEANLAPLDPDRHYAFDEESRSSSSNASAMATRSRQSRTRMQMLSVVMTRLNSLISWLSTLFRHHPKPMGISLTVLLLVTMLWMLWPNDRRETIVDSQERSVETQPESDSQIKVATMPDGFSVLLDGDALLLSWLGERGEPGPLWSLTTARGDTSCQSLIFNNDAQYRPIEVNLTANTATVARFSPLDTRAILNDIAMRGSLKLCGYQFSLKGSQAALAKEPGFRPYLQ